jgi:alanine dehydrogenase
MRTGAASGVATQYMARPEASEVGIFGSGGQAATQLQAVCKVRKVRRVQVYSPNEDHRRRFAREQGEACQVDVVPVPRPELAAQDQDIVITATASREPVLFGDWLAQGTHVNAIGSNHLSRAELDPIVLRRCQSVVVDSKDQARLEAGDFVQAVEDGILHWSNIHELSHVVVGRYAGRAHVEDVTLFKSLGIGLEDVAVAAKVYAAAQAQGLGTMLDW